MSEELQNTGVERIKTAPASEMPEPQTLEYGNAFKLTDLFVHDLKIVMSDVPYAQAAEFITYADKYKNGMYQAQLNEFVNKLCKLPYKYVHQLIDNIKNKDIQQKYFIQLNTKK